MKYVKKFIVITLVMVTLFVPLFNVNAVENKEETSKIIDKISEVKDKAVSIVNGNSNQNKEKKQKGTVKIFAPYRDTSNPDPRNYVAVITGEDGNVTFVENVTMLEKDINKYYSDDYIEKKVKLSDQAREAFKTPNPPTRLYVAGNYTWRCISSYGSSCNDTDRNLKLIADDFYLLTRTECEEYDKYEAPSPAVGAKTRECLANNDKDGYLFVYNKAATKKYAKDNGYSVGSMISYTDVNDCEGMLSVTILDGLRKVYKTILALVIIALVIYGVIDFTTAITSDSDDGLKKAFNKFMKRVIIAILIFLLPYILTVILTVVETANSKDSETKKDLDYGLKCLTKFKSDTEK